MFAVMQGVALTIRRIIIFFAALSLLVAGCGSDNNEASSPNSPKADITCVPGAVTGAGSTFVQNLAQEWIKQYLATCTGTSIDYKAIGSSGGIQQLTAGTVQFGASDVALTSTERSAMEAEQGPVMQIPWSAGGIAVMYKLANVTDLQLSASTLAGMFAGKIKKWNDAAIKADNPDALLPDLAIQTIHRSDGSGTTAAFTAYLQAAAPDVWTFGSGKDVPWPVGQGAKGSDGVTAAVKAAEGAISYAEVSYPKVNSLGIARIKNASGVYTSPEAAAVSAAIGEATTAADLRVTLDYAAKSASVYPITTVTYVLVPKKLPDATQTALARSFILYALGDGQAKAEALYYAPLPQTLLDVAKPAAESIGF